jgi:hypothetical protein
MTWGRAHDHRADLVRPADGIQGTPSTIPSATPDASPASHRNPIRVECRTTPEDLVKRLKTGVPVAESVARDAPVSPSATPRS